MKKRNILLTGAVVAAFTFFILVQTGCKKDDDNPETGNAEFFVNLTNSNSSRSAYEAVNIDIQKVSIHVSGDTSVNSGWFDLETNTGIYNLMDYTVGNDTLIAFDSLLQVQTVSQIRLLLGDNNTVVDGGETYDLDTPSGQTSGLKIQVHAELQPNHSYIVQLDFDAEKSVIKTGNGKYKLKPVINATVIQQ